MLGHDFFVINRWQKLFALLLAVLIWLAVRSGIALAPPAGDVGHGIRQFDRIPVAALSSLSNPSRFRLEPELVTVILRGSPLVLEKIRDEQLEVFVNLSAGSGTNGTRPIHVYVPAGTELVSVRPREVLVDRLPADKAAAHK